MLGLMLMSKKMLIDATHHEETRVVVLQQNGVEEFDFESSHKKQIKGNIYLAKVMRVEPSLQAAFVDYGGNRHGFLAFSDIHPDYYQIPSADKEKLLEAESHAHKQEEETASRNLEDDEDLEQNEVDTLGVDDDLDDLLTEKKVNFRKQYKIHEVIKKRQILLIQIVKEERGSKGAAVTTYLSLAGRYCVLMPNTARGVGISRKITNAQSRKHLKSLIKSLDAPHGMGMILRTAGATRTKVEIKRDYEYLLRLWENIRDRTLASHAPFLVHEEGNLIKRAIRDLYNKDIEEILVAGDNAYKEAKSFMRMLMPSHAKVVQPYKEIVPIFTKNNIETQLDKMLESTVSLKSGGYIVIDQTEALVAIDVNSGRATKESSIAKTALQTNLEAAAEVARQLRLRDLSGLVIIDFIDMDDRRNIKQVEKILRDCLKTDRARIQVGRMSPFGLVEMSRQRLRSSVLESTTQICKTCNGSGYIRSPISVAIYILRLLEEWLLKDNKHNLLLTTNIEYGVYFLNKKKQQLLELEQRFDVEITIDTNGVDSAKIATIDKTGLALKKTAEEKLSQVQELVKFQELEDAADTVETEEPVEAVEAAATSISGEPAKPKPRKRNRKTTSEKNKKSELATDVAADITADVAADVSEEDKDKPKPRKRAKRKPKAKEEQQAAGQELPEQQKPVQELPEQQAKAADTIMPVDTIAIALEESPEAVALEAPKPKRTGWWQRRKNKTADEEA